MILLLSLVSNPSWASSGGKTGQSQIGCTCHNVNAAASTTVTWGPTTVLVGPNVVLPLELTVASSNLARDEGGLNVDASGGTFTAGSNTKLSGGEITHPSPQGFTNGAVTFEFNWKSPAADGTYTLYAAGNAVDGNGFATGDGWNFATDLVIEVDSACTDTDLDGVDVCNGDCDDANDAVYEGAAEVCDGYDNDCDLAIDDVADPPEWYVDLDHDGYGTGDPVSQCDAPKNGAQLGGDCNDADANISPGEQEVCDDADTDENCDLVAEEAGALGETFWWIDGDQDSFGAGGAMRSCDPPAGSAVRGGDCNDADIAYNPAAIETNCKDPNDYNCDGSTGFADLDADGYAACTECDDADTSAYPGATEVCDGDDENCDGVIDEATAIDAPTFYTDADGDGYGVPTGTVVACTAPDGYAASADDCDDALASVFPGAMEIWYDDIDQNCDGNDDDQDLDGVSAPEDCADEDPTVAPGLADPPCDDFDVDCDPIPDDPTSEECAPPVTDTVTTGPTDTGEPPPVVEPKPECGCASPASGAAWAPLLVLVATAARGARSRRAPAR